MNLERLAYSVPELIADGSLGKRTEIYRHINEGRLEAFKRGRRTFCTATSVRRLLEALPRYVPGREPERIKGRAGHKLRAKTLPALPDAAA